MATTDVEHKPTNDELAQKRTDFAHERTQMAATRTFFAVLRTGLAIAAGGTVVTTILADGWPDWVIGSLAGVFIVVGYVLVLLGVARYSQIAKQLALHHDMDILPPSLLVVLTIILMLAIVIVLLLFLFGT